MATGMYSGWSVLVVLLEHIFPFSFIWNCPVCVLSDCFMMQTKRSHSELNQLCRGKSMTAKLGEWESAAVLWQTMHLLSCEHTQPNCWDIAQIQVPSAHLPNSLMWLLLHLKKADRFAAANCMPWKVWLVQIWGQELTFVGLMDRIFQLGDGVLMENSP